MASSIGLLFLLTNYCLNPTASDGYILYCKDVNMIWTLAQLEHDWFIHKDIWRIFYSKDLVDFLHLLWRI
jgi:hypothetical protein